MANILSYKLYKPFKVHIKCPNFLNSDILKLSSSIYLSFIKIIVFLIGLFEFSNHRYSFSIHNWLPLYIAIWMDVVMPNTRGLIFYPRQYRSAHLLFDQTLSAHMIRFFIAYKKFNLPYNFLMG